ncbi:hypothetical protein BCR37DRAFT_254569 [Protomyces lactucae-debilis]|uniref:Uncharacterized protein n=1 Tax=Protomyces lactucae-debilis TaxID=2754530 RepID=A0A1Y2FLP3_PROLT|nr:uncharacterized protein BCR37DRAFT_254569 [Protomyces lactucae-debilis]ORY84912.1 hypothetical protein BCR37DRAFT_254569 [Protomyces lactucae-debilis]
MIFERELMSGLWQTSCLRNLPLLTILTLRPGQSWRNSTTQPSRIWTIVTPWPIAGSITMTRSTFLTARRSSHSHYYDKITPLSWSDTGMLAKPLCFFHDILLVRHTASCEAVRAHCVTRTRVHAIRQIDVMPLASTPLPLQTRHGLLSPSSLTSRLLIHFPCKDLHESHCPGFWPPNVHCF